MSRYLHTEPPPKRLTTKAKSAILSILSNELGGAPIMQTVVAESSLPSICQTLSSNSETTPRISQAPSGKSPAPPFALADLARAIC